MTGFGLQTQLSSIQAKLGFFMYFFRGLEKSTYVDRLILLFLCFSEQVWSQIKLVLFFLFYHWDPLSPEIILHGYPVYSLGRWRMPRCFMCVLCVFFFCGDTGSSWVKSICSRSWPNLCWLSRCSCTDFIGHLEDGKQEPFCEVSCLDRDDARHALSQPALLLPK